MILRMLLPGTRVRHLVNTTDESDPKMQLWPVEKAERDRFKIYKNCQPFIKTSLEEYNHTLQGNVEKSIERFIQSKRIRSNFLSKKHTLNIQV